MKYIDEFRNQELAQNLLLRLRALVTRPWVVMEVCGGQTHSIVKYGLDELLPKEIELVHGPGCPVCVTSLELIDRAHGAGPPAGRHLLLLRRYAARAGILRGSVPDPVARRRRAGGLFAARLPEAGARRIPANGVVFFAIGFETTAPANAMSVWQARAQDIEQLFAMLVSHVTVPPAMTAILESPSNRVQAFLGAGHVCAVMGWEEYEPLAARYRVPIVVTGFEPLDLLEGIFRAVRQLERGATRWKTQYSRAVSREGNREARRMIARVFEPCDRAWRGIGVIPGSGYRLREEFAAYDAARIFDLQGIVSTEPENCISGLILQGARRPSDCPAFGTACTPETPLGATMVSAEGACAAYYNYGRHLSR